MPITDQEIELLEALAKNASPGPWQVSPGTIQIDKASIRPVYRGAIGGRIHVFNDTHMGKDADARFIAAANPSTVLSLIERLRELEAMVHDAYQFAGNILDIAGLFEHPEGQRALDYFSRGKADPEWRWPNEELSCGKVGGDDDSR